MATFTFDGTTSAEIEFDPTEDVLEFNVATADVVDVTENDDGVTITTASGAVLTLTGVTYAELAGANIVVQGGGDFSFGATVEGTGFSDILVGTTGDGTLDAGNGNNLVFGGGSVFAPVDGADVITAAAGNDTIYGNGGDDVISSTGGNDLVYGGAGADEITLNPATGQIVTAFGGGSDFDPEDDGDIITIGNTVSDGDGDVLVPAGGAALVFGNGGDDEIVVLANGNNTVHGGYGADDITVGFTGSTGSNLVFGSDNISAPDAEDEDAVVDIIDVTSDGNNTIFGGTTEADPLDGDDDITVTGDGNNLVFANGGDDDVTIDGEGDNTVYGGLGADFITVGAESSDGSNLIVAGQGADDIEVTSDGDNVVYGGDGVASSDDEADLIAVIGDGNNSVFGNGGGDTLSVDGDGNNSVYGGFGEDVITIGTLGDNPEDVVAANGNNVVFGGEDGDAIAIAGNGNNTVYGGTGEVDTTDGDDEIVILGEGDNVVFGNAGNDEISITANVQGVEGPGGPEELAAIFTGGSNTVYGGLGADLISVVGGAADTNTLLVGGEGADFIFSASAGNVTIYGGQSTEDTSDLADEIGAFVLGDGTAEVYGNGGNDEIEVYLDLDASASVYGGQGDDVISIEAGFFGPFGPEFGERTSSSVVYGGEGNDSIEVDTLGDVTVYGGRGEADASDSADIIDVSAGGEASATIYGNAGDDSINVSIGEEAAASVFGGQGDDEITLINDDEVDSSGSSAVLAGGQGEDSITASTEGSVTVYGGTGEADALDGADTIDVAVTGTGAATIFGNGGDDTIEVSIDDEATAVVYGGQGDDTITINGVIQAEMGVNAIVAEDLEGPAALVFGGEGDDTIDLTDFTGDATIYGGTGEVDPSDGDDVITTGTGPTVVFGNGGNDIININGDATVNGGAGEDTFNILASEADVTINGFNIDEDTINESGEGPRSIVVSNGNTVIPLANGSVVTLAGVASADVLVNGQPVEATIIADPEGGDIVVDSQADATVTGGAGADNVVVTFGADAQEVVINGFDAGEDTVSATFSSEVDFTEAASNPASFGFDNDGDLILTVGGQTLELADVGAQVARVAYTDANGVTGNIVFGTAAGNTGTALSGTSGNDFISGDPGRSALGGGADSISAGAGDDVVYGNVGNDTIDGGAGNDQLFGGAGSDSILGGDGNDYIYGSVGADSLSGGAGVDTFVYRPVEGTTAVSNSDSNLGSMDVISDFNFAEDTLDLSAFGLDAGTVETRSAALVAGDDLATNLAANDGFTVGVSDVTLVTLTGDGADAGSYLIVDLDGSGNFEAADDLVINVTGFSGTLDANDVLFG